ncbi:MAG TPA: ATP-binding protein, partial [Bacillota bacterium]|nr:ATP-binding protein [Bacillota bacterium]
YDPNLISPPVDWKPNRFETFKQLIGKLQPGRDFEAIVSSNDEWAVEAINCLADWGFGVPEDIAVVGFNNSILGQRIDPPLTSIGPSFYEQGRRAVEILMDLIQERPTPERLVVPVSLYVRQSCGCLKLEIVCSDLQENYNRDFETAGQTFTETEVIERISNLLISEHNESAVKYVEPLVKEVLSVANGGSSQEFLKILSKAVKFSNPENGIVIWWGVINNLQQWGRKLIKPSNQEILAQLWKHATNTLVYKTLINKNNSVSKFQAKFWKYHVYLTYLIKIFNTEELVAYLAKTLPDFGFHSCYLVLYEDQLLYEYPKSPKPVWSRLLLAYNCGQPGVFENQGGLFPANEFLPDNLLKSDQPFNLIVTSIYTHFYQFGYIVCDYRDPAPLAYKMIWPQLASCLRGINLLKQRQIAEESLRQQKEELARSNGELQQFANIVSHDLQEPLRKIVAFGDRLKNSSQGLNEVGRDCLQRIQNATNRMQVLINDLLNFSRVTTKAQPFSEVNLNELVREVLLDLEVKITESQAKIETTDLPRIEADPLQMRQLFQNLIGNALKFIRPNVLPEIRVYTLSLDMGRVQIVVEDNGIGIDEIYFERIFQVFERLHTRSEYEGTGIGLAICKKIIDRHHGTIRIESTVGTGTRFIISLPSQHLKS